jgi:hypothetical protein
MQLQAKQRLTALPKFMYEPTEQEVQDHKSYKKAVALAEKMFAMQQKMKLLMVSFDLKQRPIAQELIFEETGYNPAVLNNK